MSQTADTTADTVLPSKKKKAILPVITGLLGALAFGGGGFYAVYSGMILGSPASSSGPKTAAGAQQLPSYMPVENMILSLAGSGSAQHLRLSAHLEIADDRLTEAEAYRPRFLAVINTYLRAVDPEDLQQTTALIRLRAQILRRLQMVAGEDLIRDFLITEFVLN